MVKGPLFREEVLAGRQRQWLGTVLLTPRLSYRVFAAFAAITTLALFALLLRGSYTRKARIAGWLVPQQGLVQVFAPQAAVVTEISVVEGARVHAGDPLIRLSSELRSTARGATQLEIANRLESRRASLLQAREETARLGAQRSRSLADRVATLTSELAQLDSSITLQRERVELARKSEGREREIHARGLSSDQELQTSAEGRLEQESRLRDLIRGRIAAQGERLTLQGQLEDMPITARTDVANLDRDIAQVEQDLAEVEARREIVLTAPEAGTITAVQVERGGRAVPNVPLMSLVPAGSQLEAHLFSPSRSIGFLRPGQRVLLRYEAYPYQKFGHYDGVIAAISRSAVNPSELPAQLAGLTRLVDSSEPVYRVRVRLARQEVTVYGRPVPLQPGLQLDADVLIERRRLIEWVLDPLFTLTGR
jgi:membrane fusion protein